MTSIMFMLIPLLVFIAVMMAAYVAITRGRGFWGEYEAVFMDTATVNMEDMFLFVDTRRLFMFNVMAIVIVPLFVWIISGHVFIALCVMAIVMVLPFQIYNVMRQRRYKAFERILPDALTMVSGSLQAGASLNMAIESLVKEQPAPLNQEFLLFMREQRVGVDFETSIRNMERRLPIQDFQMLAAALRISREVGGNLAETLDKLADTLRRKAAMEGKIDALTGQGKMQGYVMTGLPILLGVLLYFLEPDAMSLLFTDARGWSVVTVVVIMEILGFFFIRKVTNIDV